MKINIKNLFNKNKTKYWMIALIITIIIIPAILIPISLTINKREFVLANYKSYMSPSVQKYLKQNYNLDFDYFENAEDAKKLLKQNAADIINTTSYELVEWINQGLVKKIDWCNFHLNGIKNANDALKLFTTATQTILTGYDINHNGIKDQEDNLLNYGIPYFMQDLVFAYRGNKISTLNQNMSWSQTIKNITNNNFFNTINNKPNIIALNDPRTIYSIPRLMQANQVNPQDNATIEDLSNTFDFLSKPLNKLGNIPISFNDSNSVLNTLASNTFKGAILFNGDAIFASLGGDEQCAINENDFHFIKPQETLVALDLLVFNKNTSEKNLNKGYKILNNLCLNFNINDIKNSLAFQNFDYVNYTTPLKTMYDFILNNPDYFNNLQKSLFSINNARNFEQPISNLTKSNFSFAWINFTNKL